LAAFSFNLIILPQITCAQTISAGVNLPIAHPSPNYIPATIKGIKIFPDEPLRFDFIIDTGDSDLNGMTLKKETRKLINYFLAAVAVPESDQWVNLSPYEKDRIIPNEFGITEMGRDLLAQDYILKQLTASLMYPENELGKKFWDQIYAKARQRYGTSDIPINTFNKVWIIPDTAGVYEYPEGGFIIESRLKVMLEGDYIALKKNLTNQKVETDPITSDHTKQLSDISSQIIKEILIPEIEREINEGKLFAPLRQIYHSMIMATWFKKNFQNHLLGHIYMDRNQVDGIDIPDKKSKEKIYQQYLSAFKAGAYTHIQEIYDQDNQETIPRKYFAGGFKNILSQQGYTPFLSGQTSQSAVDKQQPIGKKRTINKVSVELTFTDSGKQNFHQIGGYPSVIPKIAARLGVSPQAVIKTSQKNDIFDLYTITKNAPEQRIDLYDENNLREGWLFIRENGELAIVHRDIHNDHASTGRFLATIYVSLWDESGDVRSDDIIERIINHESIERGELHALAIAEGLISLRDLGNLLSGNFMLPGVAERLEEWANVDNDTLALARQQRIVEALNRGHRLGMMAEGYSQDKINLYKGYSLTKRIPAFRIAAISNLGANQKDKDVGSYATMLERLWNPAGITQASIDRRNGLAQVGNLIEKFMKKFLKSPKLKIAIVPAGSALKGYATEDSDIEYKIYITEGMDPHIRELATEDVERIVDELGGYLDLSKGFGIDFLFLAVSSIYNYSAFSQEANISELYSLGDDWIIYDSLFGDLFLPIAYGNQNQVQKIRKNVLRVIRNQTQWPQRKMWARIQENTNNYTEIDLEQVDEKPHLQSWLQNQYEINTASEESLDAYFDKRMDQLGIPNWDQMVQEFELQNEPITNINFVEPIEPPEYFSEKWESRLISLNGKAEKQIDRSLIELRARTLGELVNTLIALYPELAPILLSDPRNLSKSPLHQEIEIFINYKTLNTKKNWRKVKFSTETPIRISDKIKTENAEDFDAAQMTATKQNKEKNFNSKKHKHKGGIDFTEEMVNMYTTGESPQYNFQFNKGKALPAVNIHFKILNIGLILNLPLALQSAGSLQN